VVKGSCNGVTGAMDGVDRWSTAADAGTRFNGAGGAQSWIVLTDLNGADICFSYNSAEDDVYRIAVSHTGTYVAAGTPAQQPTSTTEQTINTFFTTTEAFRSCIGATASGDRVVTVWARTDGKGFRVAVARAAVFVGLFGVDKHSAVPYAPGVTVSVGHGFSGCGLSTVGVLESSTVADSIATAVANNYGPRFVVRTSLGTFNASCSKSLEGFGSSGTAITSDYGQAFAPELQGSTEYQMKRLGLFSTLASSRGKVGNLVDWWMGRTAGPADGDTYGNRQFIVVASLQGIVWPWDGTASVAGTAVVMT